MQRPAVRDSSVPDNLCLSLGAESSPLVLSQYLQKGGLKQCLCDY